MHRFFSEGCNARDFAAVGIDVAFVQDNHVHRNRAPRRLAEQPDLFKYS
jgi:dTDP-4-dehydrorhamnose 3,5-epimerase-like enzyme